MLKMQAKLIKIEFKIYDYYIKSSPSFLPISALIYFSSGNGNMYAMVVIAFSIHNFSKLFRVIPRINIIKLPI